MCLRDAPRIRFEISRSVERDPRLAGVAVSALRSALGISEPYAAFIRSGSRVPHPRHWQTLARLVGLALPHAEAAQY